MADNVLITPPSWLVRWGTSIVALIMIILTIGSFYLPYYKIEKGEKGEIVLIKPLKSHTTNQFICGIRILSDTHPPIQIGQRIEIRVEKVQTRRIELTGRVCSLNKTNGSPLIFTEIILNQNQANLLYMEIKKSKVTIITENIFLGNIILNSFKSLF